MAAANPLARYGAYTGRTREQISLAKRADGIGGPHRGGQEEGHSGPLKRPRMDLHGDGGPRQGREDGRLPQAQSAKVSDEMAPLSRPFIPGTRYCAAI